MLSALSIVYFKRFCGSDFENFLLGQPNSVRSWQRMRRAKDNKSRKVKRIVLAYTFAFGTGGEPGQTWTNLLGDSVVGPAHD